MLQVSINISVIFWFENLLNNLSIKEPSTDSRSNSDLQENISNTPKIEMPAGIESFKNKKYGNPNEHCRYLYIWEPVLTHFYARKNSGSFHNVYLLNHLILKLQGNAGLVITIMMRIIKSYLSKLGL